MEQTGRVWAFGPLARVRCALERELGLSPLAGDVVTFVAWVLTATRALRSPQLVAAHRATAELLRCSQRRAGAIARLAVAAELVEVRHAFDGPRGRERAAGYVPTARVLRMLSEIEDGRSCQPSERSRYAANRGVEAPSAHCPQGEMERARANGLAEHAQALARKRLSGEESKRLATSALLIAAGVMPPELDGLDPDTASIALSLLRRMPS